MPSNFETLPTLSCTDHGRLLELGDALLELESAKRDYYLPGFSYLDTARGVAPSVDKLQENGCPWDQSTKKIQE